MKQRVFLFLSVYLYFILLFIIEKSAFYALLLPAANQYNLQDYLSVLYHGLRLDFSMSGYLTIIPALLIVSTIWINSTIISKLFNIYYVIIISLIVIIVVTDIALYPHWGYHFDANLFLYLKNPKEALASSTMTELLLGVLTLIITFVVFYFGYIWFIKIQINKITPPKSAIKTFLILLLLTAFLFIPIRGGVTVSTMNTGKAYFSEKMFLNHAAINPQFNLLYSLSKTEDFASQYQFFPAKEADSIFNNLNVIQPSANEEYVLKNQKPNIIFIILESFSANIIQSLDGESITPNLDRIASEGILFTNFYSNSFRTDRGLVSILSGYPGHPTTAVIKYPQKTQSLPSIPHSLKDMGYDLSFYYGGDADFANMRSYIVGCCEINKICSDKDFPLNQRLTKWGVPDEYVMQKATSDILANKFKHPFFSLILTLSSHEPFDVPTRKYEEPFLNSVAYTDSCIGKFINNIKNSPLWDNTLIIMTADHPMQYYPQGLNNYDPQRFHIPMIWTGGAIKKPQIVSDYGSQNDIAATLLSQLKLPTNKFRFSKDMFNNGSQKFAFYSYVNGFSMTDSSGTIIFDNNKNDIITLTGDSALIKKSKAFFQTMYSDLGKR